jgi:hypothetical protein
LRILIIILFPFFCHAQMGAGIAQYTSENAIKWGALIGNGSLNISQRSAVAHDTLNLNWVRSQITMPVWAGSSTEVAGYNSRGLQQLVSLNDAVFRPFLTSSELPAYADTITDIVTTYPWIWGMAIEGEEINPTYHWGPLSDYVQMIHTAYNVLHPLGVKVTDGGFYNSGIYIKTYRWIVTKYGQSTADVFGDTTMSTVQINAAKDSTIQPTLQQQARMIDTIFTAAPWVDYFNLHFYQPKQGLATPDTVTIMNPYAARYIKEYVEATTGRPLICNETCARNNVLPALVTSMLTRYYQCGYFMLLWYNSAGGDGAEPITNQSTGAILPNGQAFADYITAHQSKN